MITFFKSAFGFVLVWMILATPISCSQFQPSGEELATTYCGSCHAYVDPSLLDKDTWRTGVLPRMALRLGIVADTASVGQYSAQMEALEKGVRGGYMPGQPLLSDRNWQKIVQFYIDKAPDKLTMPPPTAVSTFNLFTAEMPRQPLPPLTTLVQIDASTRTIRVGDRRGDLLTFNANLHPTDSLGLSSPPAEMVRIPKSTDWAYLLMGIMDPNDDLAGSLQLGHNAIIDSLRRPVQATPADLDRDGKMDWVVCEFGHNIGRLNAYLSTGNSYRQVVLDFAPGARRAIVRDVNADGWPDVLALMTQGDEQVAVYYNRQNGRFRRETLLRFPAVYGSSYIDLADMNRDGHLDIVYTNGDNADFSQIPKPYHGIRVFLNDGQFHFKESYFYRMPGATQALARDFDRDGDVDIAAISFAPVLSDTKQEQARVFIYLENKGNLSFEPQTLAGADRGRWMVMNAGDVDGDGDEDIVLGSYYRSVSPTPPVWAEHWQRSNTGLVLLRNQSNKLFRQD